MFRAREAGLTTNNSYGAVNTEGNSKLVFRRAARACKTDRTLGQYEARNAVERETRFGKVRPSEVSGHAQSAMLNERGAGYVNKTGNRTMTYVGHFE